MKKVIDPLSTTSKAIDTMLDDALKTTDKVIDPYRQTAFKRFPVLFTILTAFGVAAVFFGFERIIAEISWLNERPFLILSFGLMVLTVTGTLYKKLGKL